MTTKTAKPVSTEVAKVTLRDTALAEIDAVAAGLADLSTRFGNVAFDVTTTKGIDEARAERLEIREYRYKVPHIVKAKKAELKAIGEQIEARGEKIIADFKALEDPIHSQITAEEERKEAEKRAKLERERERVALLQSRVAEIRNIVVSAATLDSGAIAFLIQKVTDLPIDESFEEYAQPAQRAKDETLAKLHELHSAALLREAEQERIRVEREELAKLRAKAEQAERERQAAAKAERDAAEARRREEEKAAAAARAAEQAKLQAERDAQAAELKRQRDAHAAELAEQRRQQDYAAQVERDRLAAERAEIDRKRAEQEKAENERRAAAQALELAEREATAQQLRVAAERLSRIQAAGEVMLAALKLVANNAVWSKLGADTQEAVESAIALAEHGAQVPEVA